MGRGKRVAIALAVAGLVGCGRPADEERTGRLWELERQGRELEQGLLGLEERFMRNEARLELWNELKERHRQVSAVACQNQTRHFEAMVKNLQRSERRGRRRSIDWP